MNMVHLIPEFGNRVLIDPEARLTVLRDRTGNAVDQTIRPIEMLNLDGAHWFGLGAPYPHVRAIVTGFYLTGGGGRDALFYDDPASVLGITCISPDGYMIAAPLDAVVCDLGDQPFPPDSGPPCDDEIMTTNLGFRRSNRWSAEFVGTSSNRSDRL